MCFENLDHTLFTRVVHFENIKCLLPYLESFEIDHQVHFCDLLADPCYVQNIILFFDDSKDPPVECPSQEYPLKLFGDLFSL